MWLAGIVGLVVIGTMSKVSCAPESVVRLAVINFGISETGRRATDRVAEVILRAPANQMVRLIDRDQTTAAARGSGHSGSLNLTTLEARDLGAAIGCDFYFLGRAETVKRSPSSGPSYFESFASVFLVSARTGRLILWDDPTVQRDSPEKAEQALLAILSSAETEQRYLGAIIRTANDEREERAAALSATMIVNMSDADAEEQNGLRAPRPYRRLKPQYPAAAARAEVEATVDVLVDIDADGEVGRVEVARWAGYGLDQSVIETVKQMHFVPARRNGVPMAMRVLLRYNFRKPPA